MPIIGQDNFSSGWTPSDNELQGDPNGLLRMDNLQLDERGVVSLTRGTKLVKTSLAGPVQNIFSKTLNGVKTRYIGMSLNGTGRIDKSKAGANFTQIASGSAVHPTDHAFTSALNFVIFASKTTKKKDDGTDIRDLGIEIPSSAPTLVVNPKLTLDVSGDYTQYTLEEGTDLTNPKPEQIQFQTSSTTNRGIVQLLESIISFTGRIQESDDDIFKFHFKVADSNKILNLRIEFMLVPPPPDPTAPASDYYFLDFPSTSDQWNPGKDIFSVLQAKRGDFTKVGNNSALTWDNIQAIRITFNSTSSMLVSFDTIVFEGGTGQLNGRYQYVQVNVWNNNGIFSLSPTSVKSLTITPASQSVKITPKIPSKFGQIPTEVNEIYFYRRNLDKQAFFYFIAKRLDVSEFVDDVKDADAVEGIDDLPSFSLIKANFFRIHPPDDITMMEGMYFDRIPFMTVDKLFLSEPKNIDACDSRHVFDVSGDLSEKNMWVTKLPTGSLLLGTTNDIYELRGTGDVLEDGVIDFILHPLGVSNAPISNAICKSDNSIIYMASDGWRVVSGFGSENITGHTHLLYNEQDRFEIDSVLIGTANSVNYDCAVSKNKLWTTVTLKNGVTRRCFVFDFFKKYWYPYFTNPVSLFTEEDGVILAGYGDAGDFSLREIDTGTKLDGTTFQQFHLLTTYRSGDTPNNRKDILTLKVFADSGDTDVNIKVRKDDGTITEDFGNIKFNGPTLRTFAIDRDATLGINLGKIFQFEISDVSGNGVSAFKLFYWTIDYENRPELQNFIRITPTNFDVAGRKRFYDMPFSVNDIKQTYKVTPILDKLLQTDLARTFSSPTDEKGTRTISFAREVIGFELGLEIQVNGDGVIEFYELIKPRNIELLPDSNRFFRIVPTDLGTPSRKKFVRLAFTINTFGSDVTLVPLVDEVSQPSIIINTPRRQTVLYFFKENIEGILINGTLQSNTDDPFEFYEVDRENSTFEILPLPAEFINGTTDFGTASRKRFSRISFICNFKGGNGKFIPITDGFRHPQITFTGTRKKTYNYFFNSDKIFTDLDYELDSTNSNQEFEFYKILKPERLEILPEPVKFFRIQTTNLGTFARKRFIAIGLIIDTKGTNVTYTPEIDGVAQATTIINTTGKRTFIHYFTSDLIGVDVGGTLLGNSEFEFYDIDLDESISEKLPIPTKFLVIPNTNLGTNARKRIIEFPLVIDTKGSNVTFTPIIDGVNQTVFIINTGRKATITDFFNPTQIGVDFGGTLSGSNEFEFYGLLEDKVISEILPVPTKHLFIPYTNLGTSSRKHLVRLALIIDTKGVNVTLTPEVDGTTFNAITINTSRKETFIYTFDSDTKGIEIAGTLSSSGNEFEFYGIDQQESIFEVIPPIATFIRGTTNFDSPHRKRFSVLLFVCNPNGGNIEFTPIINGIRQSPSNATGNRKETFNHYFIGDVTFIDLQYEIRSIDTPKKAFEFYTILKPERLEIIPAPTKFFKIPNNNLGTDTRKRIIAFAIVIDTTSKNVNLIPIIDGVSQTPLVVNTSRKATVIYYFTKRIEGIDIGGTLTSLENVAFEYYNINIDETISEKLPAPVKHLIIPTSNFGIAGRKRIRTIPLIIDTLGSNVTFTPVVDGVDQTTSIINTSDKRTHLHLFTTDVFGIDFSGLLTGSKTFEFYEIGQPENVQILPVAKRFDQVGPFSFDNAAWFRSFRLRIIPTNTLITWKFYLGDDVVDSGSIVVVADKEDVYDIDFIRSVKGTVCRLEFISTAFFHRIGGELKYGESGGASSLKKIKFSNEISEQRRF